MSMNLDSEKIILILMIPLAILIYSVLLYLHIMLYVELPKRLGGIKTLSFFVGFVLYWVFIIYLISEHFINFMVFILLSLVPGMAALFLARDRVFNDLRKISRK
jgi:hypothetical protein